MFTAALFVVLLLLVDISGMHGNIISSAWLKAVRQTMYEQEVEDINAVHKIDSHLVRRLIVMPLTDAFNPNRASAMFGKVQYGDKCSMPSSLGQIIFSKPYDVPWIFEVKKVTNKSHFQTSAAPNMAIDTAEAAAVSDGDDDDAQLTAEEQDHDHDDHHRHQLLDKAYISPLDFRSPENYIFVPRWLMKSMGLKSNDIVDVSFVRIKLAGLVVMQPLTLAWDELVAKNMNPQVVLEKEINKYSSLTAGSTIAIEVDGVEYSFHVKDTKAEGNVSVKGVRVQDSDVKVDFDRSVLDEMIQQAELKKKRKVQEESTTSAKSSRSRRKSDD